MHFSSNLQGFIEIKDHPALTLYLFVQLFQHCGEAVGGPAQQELLQGPDLLTWEG